VHLINGEAAMKKILVTVGIVVVVILVVLAIIPLLINANSFKPRVQDELTKALGRSVTVGDLSASIYSGGITAKDITIADDPAFAQQPFIQAQSLKIGVDMSALIFSRKVKVRSLDLHSPAVHLLQNQAGRWNFASLGGQKDTKSSHPGTQTSAGDEVSVDKVLIEGGSITVGRIGEAQRNYTDVGLTSSDLSYTTAFPFHVTAKTPGNGSLDINGKAGPIHQQDASATPLEAAVTVKNLDLASTGFMDPKSGVAGTADLTGKVQSNGSQIQSSGDVTIKNGKFAPAAQPSGVPMTVHWAADYNIGTQKAEITTGTINIGKASAQLTGTIDTHPASPVLNMKLAGNGMAVQELQDALPAFGVVLPPSAKLQNGTANANFQVTGPVSDPTSVGNAALNNAKLANFDLGSKLKGIGSLAGISSSQDTEIQQFSANVHNSLTGGTQVTNLTIVVPSIGTITGQGTIAANNALDFHLVVKLTNMKSAVGVLSQVASVGGSNGIPVNVKGTTQNPQFLPDIGGLAKGMNPLGAQSPTKNVGGIVGGLFGKKKPQ
jgi:AsmA protein